ncbi:hypothetical protein M2311_003680 [Rhizobium leguminosarum]|uniref:hypothetical protein n=1 Tax=Rhizobium leguminosarum TaxID=384 RepID=UPI0014420B22|nr:hypothetical protein [Rhizobium leguminosarum]MDH6273590.1 hypothetical protein [Rhizobium leguminosarum]NKK01055.1 hypothetical protein [Rhizobium leguminosarum bv. viciae]
MNEAIIHLRQQANADRELADKNRGAALALLAEAASYSSKANVLDARATDLDRAAEALEVNQRVSVVIGQDLHPNPDRAPPPRR